MDGGALVAERFLSEAFRVAAFSGALRPRVAVGVEGDPRNASQRTTTDKRLRPVRLFPVRDMRKEKSVLRSPAEDGGDGVAKMEQDGVPGFPAGIREGTVAP